MSAGVHAWQDANQAALSGELDRVYALLSGSTPEACGGTSPALDRVAAAFGLTAFERDIVLLCAGVELESRFGQACAAAQNDSRLLWPTFSLALATLPGAHWSALSPDGPLRYWRLIETSSGSPIRGALKIDERILHFIAGVQCHDERLAGLVQAIGRDGDSIPAAHRDSAGRVLAYWTRSSKPVLLAARRSSDRRGVALEIGRLVKRPCFAMRAADIPINSSERDFIARLWSREAMLTGAILCLEASELEPQDLGRVRTFLDRVQTPLVIETHEGSAAERLESFRIHIPALAAEDRKAMWLENLGAEAASMNGSLDRLAEDFDLDGRAIRLAGDMVHGAADVEQEAWQVCRVISRRALDGLAPRIETKASWDDLVLPELQSDTLRQIVAQVRQRARVHGQWGFGERYSRGLGVSALFAGSSGTGKTMAAEVIASELKLDLYQIDLAGVVSKYIGETEKNLRRIFDAAEGSGAVLLFDEADALFGKRSEVRDSHDRYANLEVSYLLQRIESYRGLAILTTNMKQSLDPAFLRRLRFIVQFPFPGSVERRGIWERVFPAQTPVAPLDHARLAQLNIAGGLIRNIATHAAFLAADEGAAVGMDHLLRAARVEYAKLERPLTAAETGGWL
jgi:hypothetical protein